MNKLTKLMKLKVFLWIVVYAYLLYAIVVDGPSAGLLGLLAAAVAVCVMQVWMHSKARAGGCIINLIKNNQKRY